MRELERELPDSHAPEGQPRASLELAIVGEGRAGSAVARAARTAGVDSRTAGRPDAAERVAEAEVVLLAVPDGAIAATCASLAPSLRPGASIGHLSGATGLEALEAARAAGARTFSLHPLQTLPDAQAELAGAWAAISGSDPTALELARSLAERLGMRPFELGEESRAAYHAAAAIASNLLIALEESAVELLGRAGVSNGREALTPLVLRTVANWADRGPEALTGPIARGDEATVAAHRTAIAAVAPELAGLYDVLAERTRAIGAPSSAPADVATRSGPVVARTRAELHRLLDPERRAGRSIGLVPTMGSLHAGHRSLLAAARDRSDVAVMSLFVNPAQFGPNEDLDAYPRDEAGDVAIAAAEGIDIVYAPAVAEVYPDGFATEVRVRGGLTGVLCGDPSRRGPAHFDGVTTVVAKLLSAVRPDIAFFGQKDAQQVIVVRRMVRDLELGVEIETLPTVRETDGLAMSSRNAYLSPADRERAPALRRCLLAAEAALRRGGTIAEALAGGRAELERAGIEPEYLEARDAEDLSPDPDPERRTVLIALAARVGGARLIDNVIVEAIGPGEASDRYPRGGIGS